MFSLARNSHFLQTAVVRFLNGLHPAIEHNVKKTLAIKRAFHLVNLEEVDGDYFEFGMYEGTSFIGAFEAHCSTRIEGGPERAFHGFDSFAGFKYLAEVDRHPFFREGDFKSSFEKTHRRIKKHFKSRAEWSITPGYVEDTIRGRDIHAAGRANVAIAFIDVDLGQPARIALDYIAPALTLGSIIVLDDFFAYKGSESKGVANAFRRFREQHPDWRFRRLFDYGYGGQGFILSEMQDRGEKP